MNKIICVKCKCEMVVHKVGIATLFVDQFNNPMEIRAGDIVKCPICGMEIITRFADTGEYNQEIINKILINHKMMDDGRLYYVRPATFKVFNMNNED